MASATSKRDARTTSQGEEGFDGGTKAEFARFLSYTQRSCSEVRCQLIRALDRDHIDAETFEHLTAMLAEIHAKTGGLIKRLKS